MTAQLTATRLTEAALAAMAAHLAGFPRPAVLVALTRAGAEVRPGQLTLSAIMDRLDDGHPGPETAWAMVATLREEDSLVWTNEIALAYGTVRDLLSVGDLVAARMGFLEGYRRLLSEARYHRRGPVWMASLGYDASGRVAALKAAVEAGRLPVWQARMMVARHEWPVDWHPEFALPAGSPKREQVRALVEGVLEHRRPTEGTGNEP